MGTRSSIYSLSYEGVSEGAEWVHGPRPKSCTSARPDDPDRVPDDPGFGGPDDPDGVLDDPALVEAFRCLWRTYIDDPGKGPDDPAGPG